MVACPALTASVADRPGGPVHQQPPRRGQARSPVLHFQPFAHIIGQARPAGAIGQQGAHALAQVRAFDDALQLTGLVVTKLDGTAKGGVLAAIARERPIPVYFIGVGEKLEDLETFSAREFARALLE